MAAGSRALPKLETPSLRTNESDMTTLFSVIEWMNRKPLSTDSLTPHV